MERSDGLNNPLSPNGGLGCTWDAVWSACERSSAVEEYDAASRSIKWIGVDEPDVFSDPQAALIAIREMS